MRLAILVLCIAAACSGEHRAARAVYNDGLAALAASDYEKAEKLLVEARSTAGVDPELRFRAAYNLGLAYAAHADKVRKAEDADLQQALELAQQAASWLADAARLRKDDKDTQANLAIVRARVQSIADELSESEGKLEARLDRLIDEQRSVVDDARAAWVAIKQAGGADPLAQQQALAHLADVERGIVAETGVLQDLSADEIDSIGKKEEDKRTDEEKGRLIQLKNLDLYLLDARNRIADARRKLQELAAEDGVLKAEAALVSLKRGREQLLDPIAVMRGIAQDQTDVYRETMVAGAADGSVKIGAETQLPPPDEMPAWLSPAAIGERQSGLRDRLEEVRARFEGATSAPPPDPSTLQDPKQQQQAAQQAELLARVKAALPSVIAASTEMDKAREVLRGGKAKPALDHERAAMTALMMAIEQFADLKNLLGLAYNDQRMLVELLGPDAAKQMPADERAQATKQGLERNTTRMPRIKDLLAKQLAEVDAQPVKPDATEEEKKAADEQKAQMKQMLAQAETLRGEAEAKLADLQKALAANAEPLPPAKDAQKKLDDLRKLFFNVVEHLEQLIRDQGDTIDRTRAANTEDMFGREAKVPELVTNQAGHADMAKAITDALAAQADAAGKAGQKPQPGAPDPKTLSAAANEVRQAQQEMADAIRVLTKARDANPANAGSAAQPEAARRSIDKQASHSLEPASASQGKANDHLKEALKLLQPPQKNQKNQKKQDQKQDQQEQQQQQPQPQGGAQQRARDEDAQRQKQRQQQEAQGADQGLDW